MAPASRPPSRLVCGLRSPLYLLHTVSQALRVRRASAVPLPRAAARQGLCSAAFSHPLFHTLLPTTPT